MSVKQIEGYSIFMGKMLGKGAYGSVYIGKKESTGEQVAVKILAKDSSIHFFIKLIETNISKQRLEIR